ncbi:GNAT family N-acetyltransferase [Zavarzinia compransoris]|nr:GNAT family N-acyltransferase [Zavarzinia marina]MCF4165336.1 GNAT family N-acetyltransferase [Zavarzinia marina]
MALNNVKTEDALDEVAPARRSVNVADLEVRLAKDAAELLAAQRLRYRVFYDEMGATPTPELAAERRDFDRFDPICDHLLVLDHGVAAGEPAVVGTYRLLREDVAREHGGFYSASEFDLSVLERQRRADDNFLELGRSCVAPEYRTNAVIQLLWRAIAGYIVEHRISLMFGCGSLHGTDPDALAVPLSYLHHNHMAPPERRVRALPERFVSMDRLPKTAISPRDGLRTLPPLIKGYLRLGGYVGEGAVIDPEFKTVDCFIMVPCDTLTERYMARYNKDDAGA